MTEASDDLRVLEEGVHVRGLDTHRSRCLGCGTPIVLVEMEVIFPVAAPGERVIVRMPNLGVNDRIGQVVSYARPLEGTDRITVHLEPKPH